MSIAPLALVERPLWQRLLWLAAGVVSLVTGIVGIFLPLLPTTPFVLLAGYCVARSSTRCERWLLTHPRFGPIIADWRANRAVPLRAKQFAVVMMALSSASAWWLLPPKVGWVPTVVCLLVGTWLLRLPTAPPRA